MHPTAPLPTSLTRNQSHKVIPKNPFAQMTPSLRRATNILRFTEPNQAEPKKTHQKAANEMYLDMKLELEEINDVKRPNVM